MAIDTDFVRKLNVWEFTPEMVNRLNVHGTIGLLRMDSRLYWIPHQSGRPSFGL